MSLSDVWLLAGTTLLEEEEEEEEEAEEQEDEGWLGWVGWGDYSASCGLETNQ